MTVKYTCRHLSYADVADDQKETSVNALRLMTEQLKAQPTPKVALLQGGKKVHNHTYWASQVVLVVKNLPINAGDTRDRHFIPELGRSPGEGKGNPLQYSCLENSMDREA